MNVSFFTLLHALVYIIPADGIMQSLCSVTWHYAEKNCFAFLSHGSYCGIGGSGVPVDEVDVCCQSHDKCYGYLQKAPYFCGVYFKEFQTDERVSICIDSEGSCAKKVCTCDIAFGRCLSLAVNKDKDKYNITSATTVSPKGLGQKTDLRSSGDKSELPILFILLCSFISVGVILTKRLN